MPSAGRKRRKPRRRWRLPPLAGSLWSLFGLNLVLGLFFSPLTAVRVLRVSGATDADKGRIQTVAQRLRNVPALRVDRAAVESDVLLLGDVRSVRLWANPFGRARMALVAHRPVAQLAQVDGQCLSAEGDVFPCPQPPPGLPRVSLPAGAIRPRGSFFGAWPSGAVAGLCQKVASELPKGRWTVAVDGRGVLSFQAERGARVVMGSTTDLGKKIERLKRLLGEEPELLETVRSVNLTAPDAPVVVRG
jgi:hypothetical protein